MGQLLNMDVAWGELEPILPHETVGPNQELCFGRHCPWAHQELVELCFYYTAILPLEGPREDRYLVRQCSGTLESLSIISGP